MQGFLKKAQDNLLLAKYCLENGYYNASASRANYDQLQAIRLFDFGDAAPQRQAVERTCLSWGKLIFDIMGFSPTQVFCAQAHHEEKLRA